MLGTFLKNNQPKISLNSHLNTKFIVLKKDFFNQNDNIILTLSLLVATFIVCW